METEIHEIEVLTLKEFAEKHELIMQIFERRTPENDPMRFYAHFKDAETLANGFLCGEFGNGLTKEMATANYGRKIENKLLVFGAYTDHRKEIRCPRFK